MIKKIVFFMLLAISLNFTLFAADGSLTRDRDIDTISIDTSEVRGKLKAGVVIGYPTGITAGYRFSNFFEMNGTVGIDFFDPTIGMNALFTIVNLEISREMFPVSIGPAVYAHFGHEDHDNKSDRDDEYTKIDLLGTARMEYTFKKAPLNLFVEAGLGVQVVEFAEFAGSFAIGVRYVF